MKHETLANSLREHLKRPDEARRLLTALYASEADLLSDPDAETLMAADVIR